MKAPVLGAPEPRLLALLDAPTHSALAGIGHRVAHAGWSEEGRTLFVRLEPGPIDIELRPLSEANAMARTGRHDLLLHGRDGSALEPAARQAIAIVVARLREADGPGAPFTPCPEEVRMAVDLPETSTFWLVPGHLGNPLDLGVRAVEVLRRAALVVVEQGSVPAVHAALGPYRLKPAALIEFDTGHETDEALVGAILAALDAGSDVALFGADEGIPAFSDPGSVLIATLQTLRPALRIRTVGGPSVLGAALMRVPVSVQAYLFVSGMEHNEPAEQERRLRWVARHVRHEAGYERFTVAYGSGALAKRLARRLAEAKPRQHTELHVLTDLACPTEACHSVAISGGVTPPLPWSDEAKVVLFARARHDARDPRTWPALVWGALTPDRW